MPSLLDQSTDGLADLVDRLGEHLGVDIDAVRAAAGAAIPAILAGLAEQADSAGGPRRVERLLDELAGDQGTGDDPAPVLDGSGEPGERVIDRLFGDRRPDLVSGLSARSGIREGLVDQVLVSLAPAVVAVVARRRAEDELDPETTARLLSDERDAMAEDGRIDTIEAMLAQGAARAAGITATVAEPAPKGGVGRGASSAARSTLQRSADAAVLAAKTSPPDGRGRLRWLWWALGATALVASLAVVASTCGGGDRSGRGGATTSTSTSTSTPTSTSASTSSSTPTSAPTTTASTTTSSTSTTQDPTAALRAAVEEVLVDHPGVTATVDGFTVTLDGVVRDEETIDRVAEAVAALPGVELVVDRLSAQPPGPDDDPEGTAGETLNDLLDLDPVTFAYLSTVITPEGQQVLDRTARYLLDHPELRIEIGGHTDADGPADDNQQLSELRASEVRSYLVFRGVDVDRLEIQGYGESRPKVPNDTPENKAINRRIEFAIL